MLRCMLTDTYHSRVVKSHIKTVVAYTDTTEYRARDNFRLSSNTWLIQLYTGDTAYCGQWTRNRKTVCFGLPYCHQWLPAILGNPGGCWKQRWSGNWHKLRIWNSFSCSNIMIDGASIDFNFSSAREIGYYVGFVLVVPVIKETCCTRFICLHFTTNQMGATYCGILNPTNPSLM